MYLRWGERRGFECSLTEVSAGEVAGIKSATIQVNGDYAFGMAAHGGRCASTRSLVSLRRWQPPPYVLRIGHRHPGSDDTIEVEINPSDVRVDTYRASGAGGQHVNKCDSAVRLTTSPRTRLCSARASDHNTKTAITRGVSFALDSTRSKRMKRRAKQQAIEEGKSTLVGATRFAITCWTSPRVKDLRTRVERGDPNAVLDGTLMDSWKRASRRAYEICPLSRGEALPRPHPPRIPQFATDAELM